MKGDAIMKFGDFINKQEFELIDDGWHKVKLSEVKIVEQEDQQTGKMKKQLSCCFESVECVNSEGKPFKMFYYPNLEVNPYSEKSKLNALLVGLFGKVPDDIADIDIEGSLPGKVTHVFVSNEENLKGKTFTKINKFQLNRGTPKPMAAIKPPVLNNQEKAVKALALTKMHEAFKQCGLSPEVTLETCSNTVGREIKNTQELTLAEIKNISDFINTLINEKNGENSCDTKDDPDFVAALQG